MPVACIQGYAYMGQTRSATIRQAPVDVIGAVEAQGWVLQHVATTFVQRGEASTKRPQLAVATSANDVATHGDLVALYVFRRAKRVLAECEAKRRIVGQHRADDEWCIRCRFDFEDWQDERYLYPCATLAALALPYADHPDYRGEWRP